MADADASLRDAHTEMPLLEGRKAVITGGTTGIGRAIGVLLASEGVEIFTCGRDARHLEDGLARINEVGKGSGISVDLAEKAGLERFFAEAEKALGSYDIAIVNGDPNPQRPDLAPYGAGETNHKPVIAAIANDVYDATGVRIRRAPFRPERVLAALKA